MKKLVAMFLALTMIFGFAACGKKEVDQAREENATEAESESEEETTTTEATTKATEAKPSDTATETEDISSLVPEGAVTDPTVLNEAITYYTEGDYVYFKIKTSLELDRDNTWFKICEPGLFFFASDAEQGLYDWRCIASEFDKDWFDGIYTCYFEKENLDGIAASDEWAPGTWSVLLYEDDIVVGQWLFVAEGDGNFHFDFTSGWLIGAGEDRKVEEFETPQEEIASWFTFSTLPEETNDDWATFYFDGFYLESVDPEGYDGHYMMVCPEGNYTTYEEADAVDLTYAGFNEKCPYVFGLEQSGIPEGTYTILIAQMGGDVEVQFTATKTGNQWEMDFTDASCIYLPA